MVWPAAVWTASAASAGGWERSGPLSAPLSEAAGGYPLFAEGGIAGGIGVGGGTEAQDCAIAEHVVSVFEAQTA